MDALRRDLAYSLRRLGRSPGFSLVAILSLALGIGANTAIFSVVNAVLLQRPPFQAPEELVEIYTSDSDGNRYSTFSVPDFRDLEEASAGIFSGVMGSETFIARAGDPEAPEVVFGEALSGNAFQVLGIPTVVGRGFSPQDDGAPGASPVAVLGYGYWQRAFGGDPGVVGRSVRLNQREYTVIGVAPSWYSGTFPILQTSLWVPLSMLEEVRGGSLERLDARGSRSLFVRGRLAPGVTPDQAGTWLTTFAARLEDSYPETNRNREMSLVPSAQVALHPSVDRALVPVAALLLGVVGVVLLLACTNLAGFLLARAEARRREMAVRLSVGAGRGSLVRQLLAETVLLALAGGVVGILLARLGVQALVALRPPIPLPLNLDIPVDGTVLVFTLGVSLLAGVVFGLAPALQGSRPDLASALRGSGGGATAGSRLRDALVVVQVALSLVLLAGSGLFIRSLQEARGVDPGFHTGPAAVLTPSFDLSGMTSEEAHSFTRELVARLEAFPQVEGVALTDNVPMGFGVQTTGLRVEGVPSDRPDGTHPVDFAWVSGSWFPVMDVPILGGRTFGPEDVAGAPRVAVVSEAFAARFFPGQEAVGRSVEGRGGDPILIVGVSRDTRVRTLGEAPRPRIHFPVSQQELSGVSFVVRGGGTGEELLALTRRVALDLRPELVLFDARTMEEHLALHLFPPRMAALLLSLFGGLGLLLAVIGIFGLVSHAVARRTREVGIRVSLGATPGEVIRLVVRGGMGLVTAGVVAGLVVAGALSFVVSRFLYGVGGLDPATFLSVPALLLVVAALSAWLPARRAATVDPVRALRLE